MVAAVAAVVVDEEEAVSYDRGTPIRLGDGLFLGSQWISPMEENWLRTDGTTNGHTLL